MSELPNGPQSQGPQAGPGLPVDPTAPVAARPEGSPQPPATDGSAAPGPSAGPAAPERPGAGATVPPVPGAPAVHAAGTAPEPGPRHGRPDGEGHHGVRTVLLGVLGGVLGASLLTGALWAFGAFGPSSVPSLPGSAQQVTIDPSSDDPSTANAVAAKALPSVVAVYCAYPDDEGMGSGVVMDADGNIITNNHVIDGAESITVTIAGKSHEATLVGADPSSDLAVVRADLGGEKVTPIEVGDSSQLKVGDWVMSVGSPFGLENSVSQGIVSALYRNTLMENSQGNTLYANLIQVDAAINPGNSGGALVDQQGRLVGICTLYSSDTQSFAGIGFAIPGNYAVDIANKIVSGQPVTHAYIGLAMQTVNARNAEANHLSVNQGAYVADVTAGGPADQAGIKKGDVIVAIGDTDVPSADGAILAIRSHQIGETVQVTVVRGSETKVVDVTLGSDEQLQQDQQGQGDGAGQTPSLEDIIRWYYQMHGQGEDPDALGGR